MIRPIIISAPFGNYLRFPGASPTLGTYTLHYRGGPVKRLWRCLLTLRYLPRTGGWVNRLGLPNPGVDNVPSSIRLPDDSILSIRGFDYLEWEKLAQRALTYGYRQIEFNLSCPNVTHRPNPREVEMAVALLRERGATVIAKLPPVRWMEWARPLRAMGVKHFHCCNTIPVPGGGLSGKALIPYVLWALDDIKQEWGDEVSVIAGGGVTCLDDIKRYVKAGADHVAVGSAFLNPLRWQRLRRLCQAQFDLTKREVYFAD